MLGRLTVVSSITRGDWRARMVHAAQVCVGAVAILGYLSFATRSPLMILAFASTMGLLVLGVILFALVALFAQRTLVEEEFGQGVAIFQQGDTGQHVYVVKSGNVEVVRTHADGTTEVMGVLGPGDHFGEMALLGHAPRNATVRTVTPVRVLKMSGGNFAVLYTSLPGVREQFTKVMESRLAELRRTEPRP
jgi:CRP-like cAMP-binding protein